MEYGEGKKRNVKGFEGDRRYNLEIEEVPYAEFQEKNGKM